MKSIRPDVQSFDAAFSIIDREMAKVATRIAALRPSAPVPPKPVKGPTTPRKAA